jgi:hypothetical protein
MHRAGHSMIAGGVLLPSQLQRVRSSRAAPCGIEGLSTKPLCLHFAFDVICNALQVLRWPGGRLSRSAARRFGAVRPYHCATLRSCHMLTTLVACNADPSNNVSHILCAFLNTARVSPQQDCRMTREQGKRTLVSTATRTVNEPIAALLFNKSALCLAAFEGLGASHPNAEVDTRPPAPN